MIDEGILRGVIVVVSLVTFLGICWWAYRPQSRARFEADAWLVFEEGDEVEGLRAQRRDERPRREERPRPEERPRRDQRPRRNDERGASA